MDQKQRLTRQRTGATVPDLAVAQFRDLHAGARGVGAAAPVGHPVHAADWVGTEALDWARTGPGLPGAQPSAVAALLGGQPDGRTGDLRLRSGGGGEEEEEGRGDDREDGDETAFGDLGIHDLGLRRASRRESSRLESGRRPQDQENPKGGTAPARLRENFRAEKED